jgi:hypothetical protein
MTEPILIPPVAGETIATISSYPELVEAFRTIKARLGLSNKWCDETCDFADGVTDKLLGPSQSKGIGPLSFSMFCQIFAVKFRMEIDLDAVRKMEGHWEQREEGKVAVPKTRISKELVSKAKPVVMKQTGQIGGMVTAYMRTPAQRSEAARKAAKSRWKQVRKNRVRCRQPRTPQASRDDKSQANT